MANANDDITFLARSEHRVWIMNTLKESGQTSWEELRAKSSASRTTLQRNLNELESRGWIKKSPPRYHSLTLPGKCVTERYSELVKTVRATNQLDSDLEWFLSDTFDFDVRQIADADVTTSSEANPYAPIDRQLDVMQSADTFRWLVSTLGMQSMRVVRNCVLDRHELHVVIVDPAVADLIQSEQEYMDITDDLISSSCCEILVAQDEIPFYLGISDSVVQIGAQDDNGLLQAIVETERNEMREWALETLEEYRRSAMKLTS